MTGESHTILNINDYAQDREMVQLALASAQIGIWDWDMVTGLIRWNREHEQLFGLPSGSFDGRYETFDRHIHPDDRAPLNQAIQQALQTHGDYHYEYRILWADGSLHWIEGRGNAIYDEAEQPIRMIGTVMPIDDRKQSQLLLQQQLEQQHLVMEMSHRIRQSLNWLEILQTTADEVRQFLHVDRVIIFQFTSNWGGAITVESVVDQALAILPFDIYDPCIRDDYIEPFKQGLVVAKSDIYSADISPCHVEFLAQLQVRANLVVPILKNDELWGLLAAHHCTAPRQWQDSEIELLRQIASQASIALQQAALLEQVQTELNDRKQAENALQQLNAVLEQRVAERMAELTALNDRLLVALKEQAQTEAALRESEERRRLALDLTRIGSWDLHIASGKAIWNDNSFALLGLSPDESEASYSLWRDCVHPDDIDWVEQQFQRSIETHTEYVVEHRVVYPDSSVHWIMVRARATYDQAGQPLRMLGVLLDISDRKQTEHTLQQQTRQKQLLWNITQTIRQSLDLDVILNSAVAEVRQLLVVDRVALYRFNADWSGDFIVESVADGWVKLVEPNVYKLWQDTYLQETQGGRFQNHETFIIADIYTAELQPCHIELLEQFQARAYAIAPIFVGETLWGLFAIYQNATPHDWNSWEIELLQQIASQLAIALQQAELYQQLRAELQERKQSAAVLREAERRWRSLLDNVQLLVVGLDQFGNVNYVNAFFLSLTGYTDAEVLAKNWFENFLPSSHQASNQAIFLEVLNQNAHPYHQNSILTQSGEERFIAWNNTMLQDSQGNKIGIISIGEDITERQRVEKMKNEFISIVSHELRTPLTSIRGSLGLLATGIMDDEPNEMKRMIEIAAIDTERLVRLVNDVLDLEKLESGKVSFFREWIDAADLMQRSIEIMTSSAQEAGVQLVVEPLSVQIWVAPDRIIQTFTNLLSNAIKFSPPDSIVTLSAEIRRPDPPLLSSPSPHSSVPYILFSVQDQGRGIPAEKLESIFGRFQQVDASDSRDKGGTGLGLAICKSIVQQHDGEIWVESCWEQGSTFFFTLPLQTR
ncbi:MAG: PAS domain-containing protein [Scytolyngbya sp. HA4215-MV1]|nr:PAS domain-containing protein [Scytolyngbya sp. HA4215-MV1]